MQIFTIGHSTRSTEVLASMLWRNDVGTLVDVRGKWPHSRKNPQHNKENLEQVIPKSGIHYIHMPALGGWRTKDWDVDQSINAGWRHRGFHNYADYTLHMEYIDALQLLCEKAREERTAYMCAEAVPWRCHRLLISNTLTSWGWRVQHIVNDSGATMLHEFGKWGASPSVDEYGMITYPETAA